jgi:prephenate dehydrogenase
MILEDFSTTQLLTPTRPRRVTVIGGRGRMGQLFAHCLATAGEIVQILDEGDWAQAESLLNAADVVLVCVPIAAVAAVVHRAAPYLASTTALVDITSIKVEPMRAMLAGHAGPVLGLHPMFGPDIKSLAGQKVAVCPGRSPERFDWLLTWLRHQGSELIVCTPEEHDRLMVIVQATQHFSRLCMGVFLAQEQVDLQKSLAISSPSFRAEIEIIRRFFGQNPQLPVDIMLATPERCQAIERLAYTYSRLIKLVAQGDRAMLMQEFATAQSSLTATELP